MEKQIQVSKNGREWFNFPAYAHLCPDWIYLRILNGHLASASISVPEALAHAA